MDAMLLLKASLLLSLTLLAARLLGRAPAVTRHGLWTFVFAALLALPILPSALPALYVPVPAFGRSGGSSAFAKAPADRRSFSGGWLDPSSPPEQWIAGSENSITEALAKAADPPLLPSRNGIRASERRGGWSFWELGVGSWFASWSSVLLLTVWLTGTAAAAGALFLSLLRARRLARTATEVLDPAWRIAADTLGTRLGLRRPARLLASPLVATPMAGGVRRPIIFLPPSAAAWSMEHRDVVLAHELAHLAGHDPLRHVVARLAVALYWFHPLAWIAARQATFAREQACDETVLALGTPPSAYARVLLDLAESMNDSAPALGALPMVERSLLETRLMAILHDNPRPATRRRRLLPALGVGLLTLSVAAAQPLVPESVPNVGPAPETITAAQPAHVAAVVDTPVAVTPVSAASPSSAAAAQSDIDRDSACWWDSAGGSSFSGSISMSDTGGRRVIYEQIGTRGTDRVIQKSFGDLRLCMLAEDAADRADRERPSQWLGRARRVVMEARRGSVVHRLEIGRQGGAERISWRVGGAERAFDDPARQWRERMLAVFDTTWELSTLRGDVSTLRGQISSIRGQQSSLRGEISSLGGEVSSMRGRISSIRGEESSLRGRISSIHGHVSSLRGAISSERGAISTLNASRSRRDDPDRAGIAQHEAEIARIEQAIRDYSADTKIAAVQREIAALNADGKVAAVEAEIRAFDLEGKVAAVERRIGSLDVEGKVAAIERQIDALDADRRGRQLEERRDSELKQLEAAIAAIGAASAP